MTNLYREQCWGLKGNPQQNPQNQEQGAYQPKVKSWNAGILEREREKEKKKNPKYKNTEKDLGNKKVIDQFLRIFALLKQMFTISQYKLKIHCPN